MSLNRDCTVVLLSLWSRYIKESGLATAYFPVTHKLKEGYYDLHILRKKKYNLVVKKAEADFCLCNYYDPFP